MLELTPTSMVVPAALLPGTLSFQPGRSGLGLARLDAQLAAAGLLVGDALRPVVADIARVIADPELVMQITLTGRTGPERRATLWASYCGAVFGTPVDEVNYELQEIHRRTLTFHIAEFLSLQERPASLRRMSIDRNRAEDSGLRRLIDDATTSRFRIGSVRRTASGAVERGGLEVRDAGAMGYWSCHGSMMLGLTVGGVLRSIVDHLPPALDD